MMKIIRFIPLLLLCVLTQQALADNKVCFKDGAADGCEQLNNVLSVYEARQLRQQMTSTTDLHLNFGMAANGWQAGLWGALSRR